jgi:uncharacterized protein (TIGR02265 family)
VTTPASQHLVFDFGVESLFRGLGDRVTPALKEKVRAQGIDLDRKLLPAYPKALWVAVVDTVARELAAGAPLADARRALGHAITAGFQETTLGKIMEPGVRLIGVRRMLGRLPKMLSMSNNFLKVAVIDVQPNVVRVEVNEAVPSAEFLTGVIEALCRYAGAKTCDVAVTTEGLFTVFTVTTT